MDTKNHTTPNPQDSGADATTLSLRQRPWRQWRERPTADTEYELCSRIINGETLTAIANSLDTGVATLTDWIAVNAKRSARVREARITAASSYDDLALQSIRAANNPFELAKARDEAHHLRWRASKYNPRTFGERTTIAGDPDAPMQSNGVDVTKLSQLSVDDRKLFLELLSKMGIDGGSK